MKEVIIISTQFQLCKISYQEIPRSKSPQLTQAHSVPPFQQSPRSRSPRLGQMSMPAFTMTVHNEEDDEVSMIDENAADPVLNGLKSQMDGKELDLRKISTQESVASQKSKID